MLLDCWSIPSVIVLTWLFLKTRYRFQKIAGVAICVAGLVLVIFSDVHAADRSQSGSSPIKGDFLVLAGATLYAVSNVSEEFFVNTADRIELMAMLGLFGAIISVKLVVGNCFTFVFFNNVNRAVLEREELRSIHWSSGSLLPYTGFAAAMFLFYSGVPVLLKMSGSTMLNLSLLTSDMWSVLIRIFAYHEKVDWMYFVAFVAVAIGLVVYSGFDKEKHVEVADEAEQSRCLDEEAGVVCSNKSYLAASSSTNHESAENSSQKDKDAEIKKI
ncbi:solute carrier family 35 member F1-like protein [Tanacetum coccineum]